MIIYPSILDRRVKEHMDGHISDSMEIIISFKVGVEKVVLGFWTSTSTPKMTTDHCHHLERSRVHLQLIKLTYY